ncbi:MAG TPA: type IV secretion system protein [Gammaproteobacteria bacterium]|nr:type IV secretion system protein [Gammaproteobacteria bacterium]
MITAKTFFSDTLNTVDAVIGNYVNVAYTHLIQANSGVITMLFTFYIMLLGYRFINHDQKVTMDYLVRHITLMLIVYGLLMSWHLYNLFVYNIFTNEPGSISHILIGAAQTIHPGESIAQVLDGIYESVINATLGFFSQVSFSATGVAFLFYGLLVFLIGSALCVFALLLFIYAKMMMAVSLALGPIFISFLLWESTKGMFSAWLKKLITLALIPIITSAILALMLSVISVTLPSINQPVENMQFYGIAPFLGLSVATTLILSQVFHIASALGGGITLKSLSHGAAIVKTTVQKSGAASAYRGASDWTLSKIRKNKKGVNYGNQE